MGKSLQERLATQLYIDGEIWKPVRQYEGVYEVSDHGRVRRIESGLVLSPGVSSGYFYVNLFTNCKGNVVRIHTLVADAFLGSMPAGMVVNHIDSNKLNNVPSNLEYTTKKGNSRHALLNGKMGQITKQQIHEIHELLKQKNPILSYQEIADRVGVSILAVNSISNGKRTLAKLLGYEKSSNRGARGLRTIKLSAEDVQRIEAILALGKVTQKRIAELFGVHYSTISLIKTGRYKTRKRGKLQKDVA